MIFKYANFTIDVDVERTRAFYQRADVPTMGGQCGCIPCQNFEKAILKAPDTVLDALRVLGIDPQKPAETFSVTGDMEEDGTIWYNGWYHLCGTITESPEVIQEMPLDRGGGFASLSGQSCGDHHLLSCRELGRAFGHGLLLSRRRRSVCHARCGCCQIRQAVPQGVGDQFAVRKIFRSKSEVVFTSLFCTTKSPSRRMSFFV